MKQKWLVIANQQVAVNLAETEYTPPVVPREPLGPIVGCMKKYRVIHHLVDSA